MGKHSIAVIPGDGVGKEVVDEGIRVMETLGMQDPTRRLPSCASIGDQNILSETAA
jgi:isocitrate/isopropylmalate dehydrogenase